MTFVSYVKQICLQGHYRDLTLRFFEKLFPISSALVLGAMYPTLSTQVLSNRRGVTLGGRDNSVDIATRYGLDGPWSSLDRAP